MKKHPALEHLTSVDKILAKVIDEVSPLEWEKSSDYFRSLVESIISQQLSGKAADSITARFNTLFPTLPYSPQLVLELSDEQIRGVGISYGKISYIKDLAAKTLDKTLKLDTIHLLSDEEVIVHLTQVKGIGRWTTEMFLMFSLGREDVFSYGDLGLRNAIERLYYLKSHPTPKQAEKITSKWKPYRSWASRYLWKSLELPL